MGWLCKEKQKKGYSGNSVCCKGGIDKCYPGLAHTSPKLARYIPKGTKTYVEPFLGMGRVLRQCKKQGTCPTKNIVVNDKNCKVLKVAMKKMKEEGIKVKHRHCTDYKKIIKKYDGKGTFFMLDPPWRGKNAVAQYHNKGFSYDELKEIVTKVKGKVMLTLRNNERFRKKFCDRKSGLHCKTIRGDKPTIFGRKANTLMITNYKT